jgi:CBS domain-containing protein
VTTPQRRTSVHLPAGTVDDPTVTSMMTGRLTAVTPDTDLTDALRLMTSLRLHHLPVIEAGGRYLGVVEDADLTRRLAEGLGLPYSGWLRVGALVRRTLPVPRTARRSDAVRQMLADDSDVVLVADGDRPCGLLTATDVLRSLSTQPRQPS